MRPMHLSVAGLHSFREQVEVDFSRLCEGGVFGIFGPTGSGKSSLLDALTLALYGKVERAPNNTQGIMNHAEDTIKVAFTFELGQATGQQRYKIERVFKRTGDVTIKTTICRLLKLDEDTIVIADKANEVNDEIQQLLGLTIDDFTRAVVLPQGKFAEFLSLKGTERRQMLQRLFNLEQYGDQLNANLREKIASNQNVLNKIVAEQQGLGDASKEALQALRKNVDDIEREFLVLEKQVKEADEQYEHIKQVWQWQTELKNIEEKVAQLKLQEEHIKHLKNDWQRAQEAAHLIPLIDAYEQAQQEHLHWSERYASCLVETKQRRARVEAAEKAYQEAKQTRETEEPILIERRTEMKQLQVVEQELNRLTEESSALKRNLAHIEANEQQLKQEQVHIQTELDNRKSHREQLKLSQENVTVSVEQREMIRTALRDKATIDYKLKEKQELEQVTQPKQEKLHTLLQQEKELQDRSQNIEQKLQITFEEVVVLYKRSSSVIQKLREDTDRSKRYQEELQHKIETMKERILAVQLAKQLEEGKECPVCGSTNHPNLAKHVGDEVSSFQDEVASLSQSVQVAYELVQSLIHEQKLLKEVAQQLTDYMTESKPIDFVSLSVEEVGVTIDEHESRTVTQQVGATLFDYDFDEPGANSTQHEQLIQDGEKVRNEIAQLHKQSQQLLKEAQQLKHNSQAVQIPLAALKDEVSENNKRLQALTSETKELQKQWEAKYPAYDYGQVEKEEERLDTYDRQYAQLNTQIKQMDESVLEKENELRAVEQKRHELSIQKANAQAEVQSILKQRKSKQQQLTEQIGSQSVDVMLNALIAQLDELKKQAEVSYTEWEFAVKQLQACEKEENTAWQSLQAAEKREQESLAKWNDTLAQYSFETMDGVKEAYASSEQQQQWQETIKRFEQQLNQWLQEQTRISQLINGQQVTAEQWEQCQHERQELKQRWNVALQQKGAAQQALEAMQQKHERFMELESQRVEIESLLEKLNKLQKVFRGNSFVEYIAEEQLMHVCRDASQRLGQLTRQRYALEVDSAGGFVIRDDANGGVKRPVSSLSGGETFLTSLALALSLSSHIQLRGQYPLEFFFLDEGFGTLDPDLLDTVVTALEQLHHEQLAVGVISHVPELRARLPRRLIVQPAEASGKGSQVFLETI